MPINFRCHACDRTLSIATRKAGTQVNCPKCGVKVLVPASAGVAVESNPLAAGSHPNPALEAMPLFERPDFENLLDPAAKAAALPKSVPPQVELPKIELPKIEMPKAKPASSPMVVPVPVPMPVAVVPAPPMMIEDDIDVAEVEGVVVSRQKLTWIAVVVAVLLAVSFAVGYFLARATGNKPVPAAMITSRHGSCG
ncbi:hypothetical protein BH11PLA2_BH11PLA2_52800 [soil metagenome]